MYSGSTLTILSGRLLGAHQKIDRVARRHLQLINPNNTFPSIHAILHFEGGNGPDAMKRKSPSKDEPWHFIRPYDNTDNLLLEQIENHYKDLVKSLKVANQVRAAFEAAWLAHAIVDGLTPAHHYPYEEKLVELRNGQDRSTRLNLRDRLIMSGDRPSMLFINNWKMWGPKGLFTTHAAFEVGVATVIAPLSLKSALPSEQQMTEITRKNLKVWFRKQARQIADLKLYDNFYKTGWNTALAGQVRKELAPQIVRVVTLVWYAASKEASDRQKLLSANNKKQ